MAMEVAGQVEKAAQAAGLVIQGTTAGEGAAGAATTRYALALTAEPAKTQQLELTQGVDLNQPELAAGLKTWLAETAQRLRNPRPDCYVTLHGLPLSFGRFAWPFHPSTSGADTSVLHGEVRLEDGGEAVLHAKVAASITVTFQEVVGTPEQPFAEGFIYNAVRKTMDQGQLELVKSGNRQPVPVTTRYYSMRHSKFVFNDTDEGQRRHFLAAKAYWLSGVLGGGQPVWLLDPRDAQYLNTSVAELNGSLEALKSEGVILTAGPEFAIPTPQLMNRAGTFRAEMTDALAFLKPSFNEEMRAGLTNM